MPAATGKKPARYILMSDIHGRREAFETLLCDTFHFDIKNGTLTPPDRYTHLILNGDIVDRGPDSPGMVKLARNLAARGRATIYRGNHEDDYVQIQNVIDFEDAARIKMSERKSSEKKEYYRQYLSQYGKGGRKEAIDDIQWFRTLPYFGDYGSFRVAHASYEKKNIQLLSILEKRKEADLSRIQALETVIGVTYEYAVRETLNGKVIDLNLLRQFDPRISEECLAYYDVHGTSRTRARVKMWVENKDNIQTFSDILIVPDNYLAGYVQEYPDMPKMFSQNYLIDPDNDRRPLFLGHYSLTGEPVLQNDHVAVLDFKNYLTAYVHTPGQKTLCPSNMVSLRC